MRTFTPTWLLVALGVVSLAAGHAALAADPSQWKCETCPFETGTTGTVDVGAGYVTEDSAKYGDYTGLNQRGGFGIAGGKLRYRGSDGTYGNVSASDLGLDTRSLDADVGREGQYELRLGYSEIPRHFTDTAQTPFLGTGGSLLTLPGGFPAPTTSAMPLGTTLQPYDIGYKRSSLDLGASLQAPAGWQFRVDARHDVRDGTQRGAGSFFSTTSQLVLPVDQTTDQLEVSASYADSRLQASLAYHASMFRNSDDSLTWQNPFTPTVAGATTGQLALAPGNDFQEIAGTVGYQLTPILRASGDISIGRMTQDQAYLAPTLNAGIVLPSLPASSLDGRVDTLDASVRLTATPNAQWRVAASLIHNDRDNKTQSLLYPTVSTDMFVGDPRANLPYSFTRDSAKLEADWRAKNWKLTGGIDYDAMHRTLQEADRTHETSLWARFSTQPRENLGVSAKLLWSQRNNDGYDTVPSQTPQNPLMRVYNMANRQRALGELRADWGVREGMNLGFNINVVDDDYTDTPIGLTGARSTSFGADFSAVLSDETQLRMYAQSEQVKSSMANGQQFAQPDWTGNTDDQFDILGAGVTHLALKGKLELTGDLTLSRAHSDTSIFFGRFGTPFPTAKTSLESVLFTALWHQSPKLSLLGSFAYEHYDSTDWHLDGVGPATVPNLLAFGEQSPRYHVAVIRFAVRYHF
jgi:MtrB/PioB family decaheme-associated outer membrane protein